MNNITRHQLGLRLMFAGLAATILVSIISVVRVWTAVNGPSEVFSFSIFSLLVSVAFGAALLVYAAKSPRTGGLVNLVLYSGALLFNLILMNAAPTEPIWWQLAGRLVSFGLLITGSLLVFLSAGSRGTETEAGA